MNSSSYGMNPSPEVEGLLSHSDDQRLRPGEAKLGQMVRFGPTYGEEDIEANQKAKDSAWRHILGRRSGEDRTYTFMASISEVEKAALESYDESIANPLKGNRQKFRLMMARDGCFFLQLALHILGAGKLLGYPPHHPYFGEDSDSSSWIPAMFFVGNQIPYDVINALMKQPFFRDVIQRGKWRRPTEEDPARLVLYQTVVEPHLREEAVHYKLPPPSNILVSLHNLLLGLGDNGLDPMYYEMREFDDLETGSEDSTDKIPSAGKLRASGIKLVKGKAGIGNIRFKNFGYSARLYLPPFTIDSHTEHLLTNLASHELSFNKSQREVTAYLRFLRDLIPTYKDFKILVDSGIIRVQDQELRATFIRTLRNLVSDHNPSFTAKFSDIRRKIREYEVVPWRLMSLVCSIACGIITFIIAVLTIVQTVITVLSYTNHRT